MSSEVKRPVSPSDPGRKSSPQPLSSGIEVWRIVELRARILDHITDRNDLTSLMRVEKHGVALIVERIWRTVPYAAVYPQLSESAPRGELYFNAVEAILARYLSLTPEMISKLGLDKGPPSTPILSSEAIEERVARWLSTYQPELLNLLLPPLIAKCPALKTITFGAGYQPLGAASSWVVELDKSDSSRSSSGSASPASNIGSGRIHRVQTLSLMRGPVPTMHINKAFAVRCPFGAFTMHNRFDLQIPDEPYVQTQDTEDRWWRSLRTDAIFSNLYRAADFGALRIPLGLITSLYQRQIDAGHSDRLQVILAPCLLDFSLEELQAFVKVCSGSLARLEIARAEPTGDPSFAMGVELLPDFIATVRQSLPLLTELVIRLENTERLEEYYRDKLTEELLGARGSVKQLSIHTEWNLEDAPFNLLRQLSVILAEGASVQIIDQESDESVMDLSAHLAFLRAHPSAFATIHFPFLGVTTKDDLFTLTYDGKGQPQHLLIPLIDQWLDATSSATSLLSIETATDISMERRRLEDATNQLLMLSQPQQPTSETPEKAKAILASQLVAYMMTQLDAMDNLRAIAGAPKELVALVKRIGEEHEYAMDRIADGADEED